MISISLSDYDAIIFDMDGTMINNMPYHQIAWKQFLKQHDINVSEEEFKERISGKKNDQILESVFDRNLNANEVAQYTEEKEELYRKLYRPHLHEIMGLKDAINRFKASGKHMAIATTAPKANREMCLESLALNDDTFSVILGDEHVTHGKPNPEIYLETAKALGVDTEKCLVFEDTPPGVISAKEAGMDVIGILSTHTQQNLNRANVCINDYTEIEFRS